MTTTNKDNRSKTNQLLNASSLIHIANCIFVLAYAVQNIAHLRLLAILGSLLLIIYFVKTARHLVAPIIWNIIFILLNSVWVGIIAYEHFSVNLTEQEQYLYETTFEPVLDKVSYSHLIKKAEWHYAKQNEVIVSDGVPLEEYFLVSYGLISIKEGSRHVAFRSNSELIGDVGGILSSHNPTGTVIAEKPTLYVLWDVEKLHKVFKRYPSIKQAFDSLIAKPLKSRLQPQTEN